MRVPKVFDYGIKCSLGDYLDQTCFLVIHLGSATYFPDRGVERSWNLQTEIDGCRLPFMSTAGV